MYFWFMFPMVFLGSCLLTEVLRRFAIQQRMLDIPNFRSSHSEPTPRGGGVAVVATFLAAVALFAILGLVEVRTSLGITVSGGCVAILGFLDDRGGLSARLRLGFHFVASAVLLFFLPGTPSLSLFGSDLQFVWLLYGVAALYLVWMLNLYNFMDGIDGLAGVEAVTVCLSMVVLYFLAGHTELMYYPLLMACAAAGFLWFNYPPAKIFMGDAGSGFIGFCLGGFSLLGLLAGQEFFWSWLILLGVFIVDASVTLIRRAARGEKVWNAHRTHAYQYASRHYDGHRVVTNAIGVINICWLFPIAVLVVEHILDGVFGLVLAYIPLVLLAVKFKAGTPEPI